MSELTRDEKAEPNSREISDFSGANRKNYFLVCSLSSLEVVFNGEHALCVCERKR